MVLLPSAVTVVTAASPGIAARSSRAVAPGEGRSAEALVQPSMGLEVEETEVVLSLAGTPHPMSVLVLGPLHQLAQFATALSGAAAEPGPTAVDPGGRCRHAGDRGGRDETSRRERCRHFAVPDAHQL